MPAGDVPSFDELVDLLRVRLRDADALDASKLHSFKELMADYADVIPDNWYWEAYEELEAQGTCTRRPDWGTSATRMAGCRQTRACTCARRASRKGSVR